MKLPGADRIWYQSRTDCRKPLLLVDVESSVCENYFGKYKDVMKTCLGFFLLLTWYLSIFVSSQLIWFERFYFSYVTFKTRIKIVGCFPPSTPCQVANVSEFYHTIMLRRWCTSYLLVLLLYIMSCILNSIELSCTILLFLFPVNVLFRVLLLLTQDVRW